MSNLFIEMLKSSPEVTLDKTEPQIWLREHDGSWQVVIFDTRYRTLVEKNVASLPDYAVIGKMKVSKDGVVQTKLQPNPRFDETKIATCDLWPDR